MKIIDAELKGNLVRFYLGKDDLKKWWGDDWDDRPYEHNCSPVYDKYVSCTLDIAFPYDKWVSEPCKGVTNSSYAREDFMNGIVPLVVVCDEKDAWGDDFTSVVRAQSAIAFFMGDKVEKLDGCFKVTGEPRVFSFQEGSDE